MSNIIPIFYFVLSITQYNYFVIADNVDSTPIPVDISNEIDKIQSDLFTSDITAIKGIYNISASTSTTINDNIHIKISSDSTDNATPPPSTIVADNSHNLFSDTTYQNLKNQSREVIWNYFGRGTRLNKMPDVKNIEDTDDTPLYNREVAVVVICSLIIIAMVTYSILALWRYVFKRRHRNRQERLVNEELYDVSDLKYFEL